MPLADCLQFSIAFSKTNLESLYLQGTLHGKCAWTTTVQFITKMFSLCLRHLMTLTRNLFCYSGPGNSCPGQKVKDQRTCPQCLSLPSLLPLCMITCYIKIIRKHFIMGKDSFMCIGHDNENFYFFFWILLSFYWSIIALQGCGSFWCTTIWISCMYTFIPYLLDLTHSPTPIPPISVIPEHLRAEIPALCNRLPLVL